MPSDRNNLLMAGDLVWAHLPPFPWWPGVACWVPGLETCTTKDDVTGADMLSVIFIEEVPTTELVQIDHIRRFTFGDKTECGPGGKYYSMAPGWEKAAQIATLFLDMQPEGRLVALDERLDKAKSPGKKRRTSKAETDPGEKPNGSPEKRRRRSMTEFCVCKIRLSRHSKSSRGHQAMIGCCLCKNFYHPQCISLKDMPREDLWLCPYCQNGGPLKAKPNIGRHISKELYDQITSQKIKKSQEQLTKLFATDQKKKQQPESRDEIPANQKRSPKLNKFELANQKTEAVTVEKDGDEQILLQRISVSSSQSSDEDDGQTETTEKKETRNTDEDEIENKPEPLQPSASSPAIKRNYSNTSVVDMRDLLNAEWNKDSREGSLAVNVSSTPNSCSDDDSDADSIQTGTDSDVPKSDSQPVPNTKSLAFEEEGKQCIKDTGVTIAMLKSN